MKKNMVWALLLLALVVIVLLLNRGSVSLDIGVTQVSMAKSFAFLGFTAMGLLIGVLLK